MASYEPASPLTIEHFKEKIPIELLQCIHNYYRLNWDFYLMLKNII